MGLFLIGATLILSTGGVYTTPLVAHIIFARIFRAKRVNDGAGCYTTPLVAHIIFARIFRAKRVNDGASGNSRSRVDGEASEDKSLLKPNPVWRRRVLPSLEGTSLTWGIPIRFSPVDMIAWNIAANII